MLIREKKITLNHGKDSTDGLDDTTLTAEVEYSINVSKQQPKNVLSSDYNGSRSFLFVNGKNIYQFKAQCTKINPNLQSLAKIVRLSCC